MASFASCADTVRAAFESQAELCARAADVGGELVLKAGVHAGACSVESRRVAEETQGSERKEGL